MGEFRNRHTRELLGQEERALSRLRGRVGWGGLHSRYVGGSSFAAPARSVVGSVLEAGRPPPPPPPPPGGGGGHPHPGPPPQAGEGDSPQPPVDTAPPLRIVAPLRFPGMRTVLAVPPAPPDGRVPRRDYRDNNLASLLERPEHA